MKYLLPVLFFVILTMSFNIQSVNSAPLNGALEDINRITSEINEYNKKYEGYFRSIILKKFSGLITKSELDSLIIIADPMLIVDNNCKINVDPLNNDKYNLKDAKYDKNYYLLFDKSNESIYNCFDNYYPFMVNENQRDTIRTILRLYTLEKEHVYNFEIIEPAVSGWINLLGEVSENNNSFENLRNKRAYYDHIPFNYICFCIDIFRYSIDKCVIINNIIYSIDCMKEKYPKFSLEIIFKLGEEELEDCKINNAYALPK